MSNAALIDCNVLDSLSDGAIVVAFSGGLDSTVLLHALAHVPAARQRGLRAIHVHHGLHVHADMWARHCAAVCGAFDIPLRTARVEISRSAGTGPEAAARDARYRAFAAELERGDVLALAHHQDDQAETFLLRALRGSGPDGLAAMRSVRSLGDGMLWRPLLQTPRSALADYARVHGLAWIEDPSNDDAAFDRNFLRRHVMPVLRERWAHADASLAQSALRSHEAATLLDAEDETALANLRRTDPHELDLVRLRALDPLRRSRVMRRWVAELGLPPLPANGVAMLESEVLPSPPDRQAEFRWHGARIRAWAGRLLHAERIGPPLPPRYRAKWNGEAPLELPDGARLDVVPSTPLPAPVEVRARQGGEMIRLPGRAHRTTLKQALQDADVAPWNRENLPLLVDATDEVFAAGDLVLSADADAWMRATRARLRWTRTGDEAVAWRSALTPGEPGVTNTVD